MTALSATVKMNWGVLKDIAANLVDGEMFQSTLLFATVLTTFQHLWSSL